MACTEADVINISRILETSNFYEVLQIPHDATEDQIKSAYKKSALTVHPDKNNHPQAKEAFVAVRRAAAVLLDKSKRAEYDEYLRSPRGICKEKFDLSDEEMETILVTAGIAGIIGITAGLFALFNWWSGSKKKEDQPKYAK